MELEERETLGDDISGDNDKFNNKGWSLESMMRDEKNSTIFLQFDDITTYGSTLYRGSSDLLKASPIKGEDLFQ